MSTHWKSDLTWAALTVAAAGYEVYVIRTNKLDYTLTYTVRRHFRTHHRFGKAVFATGWSAFGIWVLRHILESSDPVEAVLNAIEGPA
jgi:hypothetical protein